MRVVVTTARGCDDSEGRVRTRLQAPELVPTVRISSPDYRRPTDDTGHSELSSLDLLSNRTFANFIDRREDEELKPDEVRSLEKALKTATSFAEKPRGWLVFTGPYGSRKSHLAAAISNS